MTSFNVEVIVEFLDAAERIARKAYLLREQFDDTANAGAGNWADILDIAADVLTALNVLTWDSTPEYFVSMRHLGGGTPAIQANNQIQAFTRIYTDEGDKASITVPAWDDTVFDEDNQNVLDPAYNTAAAVLALMLRDPETLDDFALVPQYTQSHTRKSRNVIND